MAIPTLDAFFRPFLEILQSAGALHMRDVRARLEAGSGLTPDELSQRLPSGQFTVVENRIGWARTYLFKAGLIERVPHATYRIPDAGRRMLKSHPNQITLSELRTVPALKEWLAASSGGAEPGAAEPEIASGQATTSETIARSERALRTLIDDDLRERMSMMAATRSGDSGVDGDIKEDRLGLGQIYQQAKRRQGTVGRPAIQSFVGAMHGRAQRGVFITTSEFSREALDDAKSLHGIRLRLINGEELASLMVDCDLGVSEERVYRTYKIDSDFFEEGE